MVKVKNDFAVIVLAAGEGKRMESGLSKVLHPIGDTPIIARILKILSRLNPKQIVLVVNPKNIEKIKEIAPHGISFAVQKMPKGTADATMVGVNMVKVNINTIAVMYGDDTAFYRPQTILTIYKKHQKSKAKITLVTLKKKDPAGIGRIVRKDNKIIAIVEEKDASKSQRKIKEVNDGLYFFDKNWLLQNIGKIKPSPQTHELYVTDLIALAIQNNQPVETYKLKNAGQWQSINTQKELEEANQKVRRVHIMGAAGAGAAAVAGIASDYGYNVTGCDLNPSSSYTQNLNLKIEKGHTSSHLENISILVVSPAVLKFDPQNEELRRAKKLNIPVITWQEFQGRFLQKDKFTIAVTGAYGKSTTTAMISTILIDVGLDPTCEIGARVLTWKSNFRVGKSKFYVCEADEYNDNFLNYHPDIAVILNINWDHPDYFENKNQLINSYIKFANNIKTNGYLITTESVLDTLDKFLREDIKTVEISDFPQVKLSLIGEFRKENAYAALTVAKSLNLDLQKAKESISSFTGLARRLEYKGNIGRIKIYDDYAVQPYTTQATSNALKQKFPDQKVLLVLEPHTFSRVQTFFSQFVSALDKSKVDKILITDVFAAREKNKNKEELSRKLASAIGSNKALFSGSLDKTVSLIKEKFLDFDVILSMGAGDIYNLYDLLRR